MTKYCKSFFEELALVVGLLSVRLVDWLRWLSYRLSFRIFQYEMAQCFFKEEKAE